MKKPEELIELLETLRDEIHSSAYVEKDSSASIYIEDSELKLNAAESALFLHSPDTVSRVIEALGSPPEMSVEIHSITIDEDVKQALDDSFLTVDEL